jgi:hypothetical protein
MSEEIDAFVGKWTKLFNDPETSAYVLAGRGLAEDCERLGFKMDRGESFVSAYDVSWDSIPEMIDTVGDPQILGNAIYSCWRYFNHWAWDPNEICEPENRKLFIIALARLADIS